MPDVVGSELVKENDLFLVIIGIISCSIAFSFSCGPCGGCHRLRFFLLLLFPSMIFWFWFSLFWWICHWDVVPWWVAVELPLVPVSRWDAITSEVHKQILKSISDSSDRIELTLSVLPNVICNLQASLFFLGIWQVLEGRRVLYSYCMDQFSMWILLYCHVLRRVFIERDLKTYFADTSPKEREGLRSCW